MHAQSWQWAQQTHGNLKSNSSALDVDRLGNVYVTGSFADSISFGTTTLRSDRATAIYLVKYDGNGSVIWATIAATGGTLRVTDIDIDNSSNISIVGQFLERGYFGSEGLDTLTSHGDFDAYVAKYSDTGSLLWTTAIGATGHDYGSGVSSDALGYTYVTGDIHISPYPFSSSKVFIGKFNSSGENVWLTVPSTFSTTDVSEGISTDSVGNSYITGRFFNTLTFDSVLILNANNVEANVFIGKFSPDGTNLWLQKAGSGSGYCGGIGIDIDADGNSYVTGYFHGSISFGSLQLSSSNGMLNEVFLAKCNTNGAYQWAVKPDGIGQGEHVSVTESGECYVSGTFYRTLRIGTNVLSNAANSAIFLIKADTIGQFVAAQQIGGIHNATLGECKVSSQGVFVSGSFLDSLTLSPSIGVIGDTSSYHLFVAKMNTVTEVVEHPLNDEFVVFPNPSSDHITVVQRGALDANVEILNSIGERVVKTRTTDQRTTIDVSTYPTGMYVVRLQNFDGTVVHAKMMIE